jgi:hypothetical protein
MCGNTLGIRSTFWQRDHRVYLAPVARTFASLRPKSYLRKPITYAREIQNMKPSIASRRILDEPLTPQDGTGTEIRT